MLVFVDALARIPTVSVGTQALILGALQIIRRRYADARFVMLSAHPTLDRWFLQPSGFPIEFVERSSSQIGTMRQMRDILGRVDAVACAWGDAYVTFPPHFMLRKILCLKRSGVPLVLFTASLGPFPSRVDKLMARLALARFDRITVRDVHTERYLNELGMEEVHAMADTAFVLDPSPLPRVHGILHSESVLLDRPRIGLNISILLDHLFRQRGLDEYASVMARFVRSLLDSTDADIVLIPHQIYPSICQVSDAARRSRDGDDRVAIAAVLNRLGPDRRVHAVMGDYSAADYKGMIAACDMFVGGRMHSVISAVSTHVPSLIMQYSHKAGGVMEMLGLQEHVWDISRPESDLLSRAVSLWSARLDVRSSLERRMPSILADAYGVGDVLRYPDSFSVTRGVFSCSGRVTQQSSTTSLRISVSPIPRSSMPSEIDSETSFFTSAR